MKTKYDINRDLVRISVEMAEKISVYCKDYKYSDMQLQIIKRGIEAGIDVTPYAHPDIPARIMGTILEHLSESHRYVVRYRGSDNITILEDVVTANSKAKAFDEFHKKNTSVSAESIVDISYQSDCDKSCF